ncbi:NAD-dependent epimerase/dehydratase family protein [Gaiella sp.]|uniref:NAD-dependent epimerase/dehydratase family protein n=1 Tax=Gaiella sp. TaxID=2663207 RepID=UPI002E32EB21|nr:NAD-dependent epimerase/dehydratase family protein [Gaiella sp.]HEX5582052.1 NAD-dependent epimerase/dehydratase family protein [Gaiella sp.]
MRAVVTGGAGFIGSTLVDTLLARGDEVHVVDDLSSGRREQVAEGATLHVRDIREPLAETFAEARPDVVFHLAAQVDVRVSVADPAADARTNVIGTVNVLEAARAHDAQVVFTSTGGAIYGECDEPALEEDARLPVSPYGTSKLAGEEYLATWNRLYGSSHVALRLGNVYGPRQDPHGEAGVVAIFLSRIRDGKPATIFGDGRQTRDYVAASDVVRALVAAVGAGGGGFNVGTGVETSVLELWQACREATGVEAEVVHDPPRLGELQRSVLDPGRAERELGWRPEVALPDGLRRTWEWLREE